MNLPIIGLFPYALVFVLLLGAYLLLPTLCKKRKSKKGKVTTLCQAPKSPNVERFGIILLCVALLLEIFVANFQSFHLIFGDYETHTVDLQGQGVTVSGAKETTEDGLVVSQSGGQKIVFEIKEIKQPIGSLHIDLDMPEPNYEGEKPDHGTTYVDLIVDAKDVTQSAKYRNSVALGQIIRDNPRSSYISLDLSGDVEALRMSLKAPSGQSFTVKSITYNQTVPMQFSVTRLLAIVGIVSAIYALLKAPAMLSLYGDRRKALHACVFVMTAVMVLVAVAITFLCNYKSGGTIFLGDNGNQMTKELVDAFEAGQVHLLDSPSQALLDMENPYDWSARREAGISCKWDHLLFEGKYYSYYGIAPVLLLFLPFHLLTGQYFTSWVAILLFGALGIVFLSLFFLEFCKKFCKKLPNNVLLCTLFVMQMSSGVWYNFMSPLFYEIAQSSGFLCTCAGFYFLLRSNVIGDGVIKYRHIVFSTLFLSLAVLCRPTLALYCVTALVFLFWGLVKQREGMQMAGDSKQKRNRALAKYLVASLSCFVVIGGVQMIYNYLRFGNFFDFGIQYSLTINDFTRSQYHTDLAMIGFWNFLFAFPIIKTEFPYVFSNFSTLDVNGYYYIANRNAVGLFIRALPTLGFAGSVAAWKQLGKREKWQAATLLLPVCVIAPLVIIFSIWESGYGVRYCCDFAWEMILGGAAILFFLYVRKAEPQTKRLLQIFFVVAAVVALIINGAMLYDYIYDEIYDDIKKLDYLTTQFMSFERLFDFWV